MTRCYGRSLLTLIFVFSLAADARAQDSDNDGIPNIADNCQQVSNQDQHDGDQDLFGDACDADLNNDGAVDFLDLGEFKQRFGTRDRAADLNGDGFVDFLDLGRFKALFGLPPGPRGRSAAEFDPPQFSVDASLVPSAQGIAGIDGGPMRPLDRVEVGVGAGYGFDIVRDEVVLASANPAEVAAFVARWSGTVLYTLKADEMFNLPGARRMYLIRINPSAADTSHLAADAAALDGRMHGKQLVSSTRALQLVAAVAAERRVNGLDLALNVLAESGDLSARVSNEAALAGPTPDGSAYQRNAFGWPYLNRNPDLPGDLLYPLDTGVAESWRALQAAGRLFPQVRVAIADGGFYPNADFPGYSNIGPLRVPNPDPSACGGGGTPSATCAAHGTHVVMTGFARTDNAFGTAGPGGPVSDLILAQSPSVDVASIIRYAFESVPAVVSARPRVLNISAGVSVPGGWCVFLCEPVDFATALARRLGIFVVAAAMNDSINVDATDEICVFVCVRFEEAAVIPCESDHVLCVGALDFSRSSIASFSNSGSDLGDDNTVDIYAPGVLWSVNALNADIANPSPSDFLNIVTGTSFASPFVAGVASLVMAGNPLMSLDSVESCLLARAHTSGWSGPFRRVDALDSVRCALGGLHPFLNIVTPGAGAVFYEGSTAPTLRADADDYEDGSALAIQWTSSLDGVLGTTTPGSDLPLGTFRLRQGNHTILARVTDSSGRSVTDQVVIQVQNSLPTVSIVLPSNGARYYLGATIDLAGTSFDANRSGGAGPLANSQVSWERGSIPFATGHTATLSTTALGVGAHTVGFRGLDDQGGLGYDFVTFFVDPVPANLPPNVQILQPAAYTDFGFVPVPHTFQIRWSASDPEDGPIPFAALDWFVSTNGAPEVPLTVTSSVVCVNFDPILGCLEFQTVYRATLGVGTHHIRVETTDSGGQPGGDAAVVVIRDLI